MANKGGAAGINWHCYDSRGPICLGPAVSFLNSHVGPHTCKDQVSGQKTGRASRSMKGDNSTKRRPNQHVAEVTLMHPFCTDAIPIMQIVRLSSQDVPTAYAYELEAATIVQPEQVVDAVKSVVPQNGPGIRFEYRH